MLNKLLPIAGGLAVVVAMVYVVVYGLGGSRAKTPAELLSEALTAPDPAAQERAAAALAAYGESALPELRQMLTESKSPQVRAMGVQALGAACDYSSMKALLDALDDESLVVRTRAGAAVNSMLGRHYQYHAEEPEAKRAPVVAQMRELWKNMDGSPLLEEYKQRRKQQ